MLFVHLGVYFAMIYTTVKTFLVLVVAVMLTVWLGPVSASWILGVLFLGLLVVERHNKGYNQYRLYRNYPRNEQKPIDN